MYFIYCIYFSLRIFTELFSGNFLIIKELEYEDAHAEVEEIRTMLQNIDDRKFMKNYEDQNFKSNYNEDYNTIWCHTAIIMAFLNTVVVV